MYIIYIQANLVIYEYTVQEKTHVWQGGGRDGPRGTLRRLWHLIIPLRLSGWAVRMGFMILLYSMHIPSVYFIMYEISHNLKKPKATTLKASLC